LILFTYLLIYLLIYWIDLIELIEFELIDLGAKGFLNKKKSIRFSRLSPLLLRSLFYSDPYFIIWRIWSFWVRYSHCFWWLVVEEKNSKQEKERRETCHWVVPLLPSIVIFALWILEWEHEREKRGKFWFCFRLYFFKKFSNIFFFDILREEKEGREKGERGKSKIKRIRERNNLFGNSQPSFLPFPFFLIWFETFGLVFWDQEAS